MISNQIEEFDLKNYEKHKKIFYGFHTKLNEIINISTGEKNVAKISKTPINEFSWIQIHNLYREVYINSMLNHPTILKYIGFSSHDFKFRPNPVIVFENISNMSLGTFLQISNFGFGIGYFTSSTTRAESQLKLNPTKKLIILYGIASGMSYLHSNNIIHRNLNSSSIFFDDHFLPKISGFDISKELDQIFPLDEPRKDGIFQGNENYFSPEILSNFEYGKPSDVYSFSHLMYEIMTCDMKNKDSSEERPKFDHKLPECYQNMIVKCWSENPKDRPTFDEIVNELRNNHEFITDDIDEEEYRNYIKMIDDSEISFGSQKVVIPKIDEILISRKNEYKRSNFDSKYRGPLDSDPVLDIQKYKTEGHKYDKNAVDKETNMKYNVYFCSREINNFLRHEIVNFARSINIMSQINHPAIENFIGYSPVDFDNFPKPVFITEFSNKKISKVFENNNNDSTLILIIFYGVASAMAYLQEHNILHRNLKKSSIHLNHYLLPVLSGFEIAKEVENIDLVEPNETIKGAPVYIAPEVYLNKGYHKNSDVYSYALILYELLVKEKPYKDFRTPKLIKEKVCQENFRPKFSKQIPKCYRELIEKCWQNDPEKRPTFKDIVIELKTNPDFITDTVDKERFFEYVAYLDEFPVTFEPNRRIKQFDDILNNRLNSFFEWKNSAHSYYMRRTETNNLARLIDDDFYLNSKDFTHIGDIKTGNFYQVILSNNNIFNYYCAMKCVSVPTEYLFRHEIINLSRELNILLQINHPSILQFYGYCVEDDNEFRSFVEFSEIGSLDIVIKIEKKKEMSKLQLKSDSVDANEEEEDESEVDKDKNKEEQENQEEEENDINHNEEEQESEVDKDKNKEEEQENQKEENDIDHNEEEQESEADKDKNKEEQVNQKEENGINHNEEEQDYESNQNINEEEEEEDSNINMNLDDTKIFIIIYGIAAGMEYLHLHNILHRDLKPSNIYLNFLGYPKISGFNISKEINDKIIEPNVTIKGTPAYIAPEVYLKKGYSKSSDVYSYALVLYEILTREKPYKELYSPKKIMEKICQENYRPEFNKPIPKCYQELIEKCWQNDPAKRPTFAYIINELKNNPEFTKNVDKESLQKFYEYLEKSPKKFESSSKIQDLEEFIKRKFYKFEEYQFKINLRSIFKTETSNVSTLLDYCNINDYEKIKRIAVSKYYKLYKIRDKKTQKLFIAKKILELEDKSNAFRLTEIPNEIENITKVNHPSFLKFLKYSPYDFNNKPNPIFIYEYAENKTLKKMILLEQENKSANDFDDTKKLIIIYGIASAMSYLHSINIILCNLRPSNIFLDNFLFPKITGFDKSRSLSENPIVSLSDIKDYPDSMDFYEDDDYYNAPELIKSYLFSSACDVFSFALIVFQLIAKEDPFLDINDDDDYTFRPSFKESIPNCYKKLISKCWDHDPKKRPTFDENVKYIKTNNEFITENVNKEEFLNYVHFIDEIENKYNNNELFELDNIIENQNSRFRKIKIDYSKLRDLERLNLSVNLGSSDLNNYTKQEEIGSGGFGEVYKVLDKQNGKAYAAKVSIYEIDICTEDIILNLSREIDIISSIEYPSILKFIGYNPKSFSNKPKPVIITELAQNKSLNDIFKKIRSGKTDPNWNDTKKLINLYGIAAGMSYLYNRNIIHRDLKPENILLDEYLYPKIADFGMSKYLDDNQRSRRSRILFSGFKGTVTYSAPEILRDYKYTYFGDVYSYAMIAFEIMTGQNPFAKFNTFTFYNAIDNGYRPEFNISLPYCYRNLIQKCWNEDYTKRPIFPKICKILETDLNFITPNVNKDEFYKYIDYVKQIHHEEGNDSSKS